MSEQVNSESLLTIYIVSFVSWSKPMSKDILVLWWNMIFFPTELSHASAHNLCFWSNLLRNFHLMKYLATWSHKIAFLWCCKMQLQCCNINFVFDKCSNFFRGKSKLETEGRNVASRDWVGARRKTPKANWIICLLWRNILKVWTEKLEWTDLKLLPYVPNF